MRSYESGSIGEDLIAARLTQAGWTVLCRNFRRRGCELDIVAEKNQTLAVIEVKHRRLMPKWEVTLAEEFLPWRKQRALQRGAEAFLTTCRKNYQTIRFDLAIVVDRKSGEPQIFYYANVFEIN